MEYLFKTEFLKLPDGRKIIISCGPEWSSLYNGEFLIPILQGRNPQGTERVKSSVNAKVWKTIGFPNIFIKVFTPRGIKDKLLFSKSRARRAADSGALLKEKGFLTPAVLAEAEVRKKCARTESILITREIKESMDIYSFVDEFFGGETTPQRILDKRDAVEALGFFIGRLHRNGIFHGDLRPGNVLVTKTDQSFDFHLIDNERNTYFPRGLPDYHRMKNLVQINMIISPKIRVPDRMRFFGAYLQENPDLSYAAKDWVQKVFLKTRKRLQKNFPGMWTKPPGNKQNRS